MSKDETPTTPAEQEANAARLHAEAAKAAAEARKFEAEARTAEAEALRAELSAKEAVEADKARRAADNFHHVYRFDGAVSDTSVKTCMVKLTEWHRLNRKCNMEVVFSSPGGSVIDGLELFDFLVDLQTRGHKVSTGGTGMAASMAGILLQAGEVRWMSKEAWLLIHRVAFGAVGKTYEVEDEVKFIKRIEERVIGIFCARSKLTPARIKRNWERKDWWLTSDQALELGLIDEIRGSVPK